MDDKSLDINDYTVADLLDLFGIDEIVEKKTLLELADEFIKSLKESKQDGNDKYANFFSKALNKILSDWSTAENIMKTNRSKNFSDILDRDQETNTEETDDGIDDEINNETYDEIDDDYNSNNKIKETNNNFSFFDSHVLQKNENLKSSDINAMPFVRGDMNPTQRHTYTTWISIDSQYREFVPPKDETSTIKQLDRPTDFTFALENPQKNVLKMSFYSIEIPLGGYYVFSKEYNNLSFDISDNSNYETITIEEGNYTDLKLINEIKTQLQDSSFNHIDISLNTNNNKVTFYDISNSKYDCSSTIITWYDDCSCNNNHKINSTLGWALGFRTKKSHFTPCGTSDPSCCLKADAVINITGSKYLILEIDDFNRNRYTGNMISMSMPSSTNKFKIPSYVRNNAFRICPSGNNTTSGNLIFPEVSGVKYVVPTSLKGISAETFKRESRKGTPANPQPGIKGEETLTMAQKFTAKELMNSRIKTTLNQHYAPQSENILLRLPIERDQNNSNKNIIVYNFEGFDMSRKYYGPVTIEKIRVRLIDDKGMPIELNGGEISMSLLLEKLYQY